MVAVSVRGHAAGKAEPPSAMASLAKEFHVSWLVQYHAPLAVVETEFRDSLSPTELVAAVRDAVAVARAHGAHLFLADCLRLTGGHSVFDLFALAERLPELGLPRGSREALIMPSAPGAAFDAEFWETVCRNRGFEVRGFTSREQALAWLANTTATADFA